MLKKFSRSFERKRDGKTALKFRFDLDVIKITGVFASPAALRVLWTRGKKVQVTESVMGDERGAEFHNHLSQVATIYKDAKNAFEIKDYDFILQTVSAEGAVKKPTTVGRGCLNLAQFAAVGGSERTVVLHLNTLSPQAAKGLELHIRILGTLLKGTALDDSLSSVSGLSTITPTSHPSSAEQDLTGFDGHPFRRDSGTIGTLTVSASSELCNTMSHVSDKSSDSAMINDGLKGATEIVGHLQRRVDELETQQKRQDSEREDFLRLMESQKRQSDNDLAFLRRELELERAQKIELENQLVREVDETPDDFDAEEALQAAIAPYEMRYQTLMHDYQELVQQTATEIDGLHEELLVAKDRNAKLESSLETSERARESLNVEKRALEMSLIGSCSEHVDMANERKELRQELTQVDEVMQELIQTKLYCAEMGEKLTVSRRELCKTKEKNLQLASRVTKMETYLYRQKSSRGWMTS